VVLTGRGHAGAVNIVRLTGVRRLQTLIGGLHLSDPAFEPNIPPTVAALTDPAPDLPVPGLALSPGSSNSGLWEVWPASDTAPRRGRRGDFRSSSLLDEDCHRYVAVSD